MIPHLKKYKELKFVRNHENDWVLTASAIDFQYLDEARYVTTDVKCDVLC